MDEELGGHRRLIVWQQSVELAELTYSITAPFPKSEDYASKSQMRRAANSIAANIAEGSARGSKRDFVHFLRIAKGSLRELDTHAEIAFRCKLLAQEVHERLVSRMGSVSKLLTLLVRSLNKGE